MRYKKIVILGLVLILISTILSVNTSADTEKNAPVSEIQSKLIKLFGEKANKFKILKSETIGSKTQQLIEGNGALFRVDDEGNLISFTNKADYYTNIAIPIEEAKDIAINKIKELRPDINLNEFTLTLKDLDDNGKNKSYNFRLERISNDIVISTIIFKMTTAGEIANVVFIDNDPGIASSEIKVSKEDAINRVVEKIKSVSGSSYDNNKFKIIDTGKFVKGSSVLWRVNVGFLGRDENADKIVRVYVYFVNAITGEVVERP